MTWLAARSLMGIERGWWVIAAITMLVVGVIALRTDENADDRRNQDLGAASERAQNMTETLKKVEQANEAAENVLRNSDAARDECLRNARNTANC